MENSPAALPLLPETAAAPAPVARTERLPRWWSAVIQVILVSGIPTPILIATVLILGTGMPVFEGSPYSLEFVATVSLLDTALVALLIRLFLSLGGETSHDVFVGRRAVGGEILRGLLIVPLIFIGVTVVVITIRAVAPWMHTVETNPHEAFMRTPFEAAIFAVVVVLAGGIREELQRAFILHRFGQSLGGARLGLVLYSLLFAVLHYDQGWDAAFAVGLLGVLWGVLYLRRRSAVMAMTSHAGFNIAQVFQIVLARAMGF